ncbi:MAG: Unknown protein [uncultured Sulfurovum sp.]|uniref:Sulfotransferase domain-containing protein n=1 Tax=uncultured Sulfurovum sp. TaxID=269237 RepID=A0A6S6T7H7_9BACT|nr:MAG: Unknown protein [uncultured Sulfurovum sp.]
MKTAYFVLGMHRSGTSALSGTLNLLGLAFGTDLLGATKGNAKGHFENMFVYRLNEKILKENNFTWDSYYFDFNKIGLDKKEQYIEEAKKIIESEFGSAEKFVIKDPRICLLFPIWEEACLRLSIDIKIILPYRNPVEVAESLQARNSFSIEKGYLLWLKHFLLAENYARAYVRMFISFEELLNESKLTLEKLRKFIHVELTQLELDKINEFLDSDIKHNNSSLDDFPEDTPHILQESIAILKTQDFDNNLRFDSMRNEFNYLVNLFVDKKTSNMIQLFPKLEKEYKALSEKSLNFKIMQDEQKRLEERLREREEEIDGKIREQTNLLSAKEDEIEALNSKIEELIEDNIAFKEKKNSLFTSILKRS